MHRPWACVHRATWGTARWPMPGHRRERATLAGWACHVGFHSDLNGGVTEDLSAEGGTRLGLEVAL